MKKPIFVLSCILALGTTAAHARTVLDSIPVQFDTQARLDHLESFSFEADDSSSGAKLVLGFRAEDGSPDLIETDALPKLTAASQDVVYSGADGRQVTCATDSPVVDVGVGAAFEIFGALTGNPLATGAGALELERAELPGGANYNFNYANRCEVVIDHIDPSGDGSMVTGRLVIYN